jgi:hypothetical protein
MFTEKKLTATIITCNLKFIFLKTITPTIFVR